ncbi:MAG: TIGR03545 family protein [Thermodesulfobacteriota bacterium]
MKKLIRWPGLLAFVVLVGVLVGFWALFADKLVERMIERQGTAMVGAKVEITNLDLTLVPAGMRISGFMVTDPDSPMTNAVEIDEMALTIDSANLLLRKLIVNEMAVEGLRFGTARSVSGAVEKAAGTSDDQPSAVKKALDKIDLPAFELPNPQEILAKEELETIKLANTLKTDIADEKIKWENRLQDLPDKAQFEQYRKRISQLKAKSGSLSGMVGKAGESAQLYQEVKADLNDVKAAKEEFLLAKKAFETWAAEVAQLPARDLQRLMEKYSFSFGGMANISGLLFGEKITGWINTARVWYERLKPYIARAAAAGNSRQPEKEKPPRGKGVNVRFREATPLPDFLIRDIKASAVLALGKVGGEIKNLTLEQHILGAPTTFAFGGTGLKRAASVSASGVINYVAPERPVHSIDLAIGGYDVRNARLVDSDALPLEMESALADLSLRARLDNSGINGSGTLNVNDAAMVLKLAGDPGPVKAAMGSALADIRSFNVEAAAAGPLEKVDITLSSDLDDALRTAVTNQLAAETQRIESELKAKIEEKVQAEVGDTTQYLAALNGIEKELLTRVNLGESLLAALSRR